jgi:hypothetical protein
LEKFLRDVVGGPLTSDIRALLDGHAEWDGDTTLRAELLIRLYHRPNTGIEDLEPHALPQEYETLVPFITGRKPTPIMLKAPVAYFLKTRGLPPAKAEEYDVGFCRVGRYANRLIFPVRQLGRLVYFTSRYCGDHPVKSLNPPNVIGFHHKTDVLLNYDNVMGAKIVAVCEGPVSAMAHEKAVCLLGKTISPPQIALLEALLEHGLEEIVVSVDADAAKQARQIYYACLGRFPKVRILSLNDGDPDDHKHEIRKLMDARSVPTIGSLLRSRLHRSTA